MVSQQVFFKNGFTICKTYNVDKKGVPIADSVYFLVIGPNGLIGCFASFGDAVGVCDDYNAEEEDVKGPLIQGYGKVEKHTTNQRFKM